jgi:hypothetical protein
VLHARNVKFLPGKKQMHELYLILLGPGNIKNIKVVVRWNFFEYSVEYIFHTFDDFVVKHII